MEDLQTRDYNSGKSGQTVMNNNSTIWNPKQAIVLKKTALDDSLVRIEDLQDDQETDTTGTTSAKRADKRTAADSTWPIAKVVKVFARDTNNLTLLEEIDFEFSALLFVKDVTAQDRWQLVHDRANTHLAPLIAGGYGITAQQLTDQQADIDAFVAIEGAPRAAKADSKAATAAIALEIKKLNGFKGDLIDLCTQFAKSNADFYNALVDSFERVDTGTRHQTLRITYLDDATGVRLAHVNGVLTGETTVQKQSSKFGVVTYTQQESPEGNYTLDSTKTGYVADQRTNLGLQQDKLLRMVIRMRKV